MDYCAMGKKVRKLRKSKKWTQVQLAQKIDVSVSFLGHIERGSRKASIETLVALANALGVGTDQLLVDSLTYANKEVLSSSPLSLQQKQVLCEVIDLLANSVSEWRE